MSEGKLYFDDWIVKYILGFVDSLNDIIKGKNILWIFDLLYYSGGFLVDL